jgi:enterochelin esterase-like enzyme
MMMFRLALATILISFLTYAQTPRPARPVPPTRDPHTPGYVQAKELPDGENAPANSDGNFILGPTHSPAPEMTLQEGVPQGAVYTFTMESTNSKIYPGIAREPNTFGASDPDNPAKLIVTTSHPAPYTRQVAVYVPKQYVPGTAAPFIVGADGPDKALFTALDNLIAEHKVPVMIAISLGNGSGDAQGSERGLEYDTMSGQYAEFVEKEVLPLVEKQYNVKLTKDPDGRATMGGSSGGSCALIMAWYHPELYHRVLTYSGTYVNQQWPWNPETPQGAWGFHQHLIPDSPAKPIRLWMEVGDRDLFNPNSMRDNVHDWVLANENMAKVLAAKGYHYQFVFVRNAGHTDRAVKQQTLPEALEYLWQGYPKGGPAADLLHRFDNEHDLPTKESLLGALTSQDSELGPALLRLAESTPNPDTRWMAMRGMATLRYKECVPFLKTSLQDPDGLVRANAARALGDLGIRDAAGALLTMFIAERDAGAVEQSSLALRMLHINAAAPYIREKIPAFQGQTRIWLIQALGALGGANDVPLIAGFLDDPRTGRFATEAIGELAGVNFGTQPMGLSSDPTPPTLAAQTWWKSHKEDWPRCRDCGPQ